MCWNTRRFGKRTLCVYNSRTFSLNAELRWHHFDFECWPLEVWSGLGIQHLLPVGVAFLPLHGWHYSKAIRHDYRGYYHELTRVSVTFWLVSPQHFPGYMLIYECFVCRNERIHITSPACEYTAVSKLMWLIGQVPHVLDYIHQYILAS